MPNINAILGVFLLFILGTALIGPLATQVVGATGNANVSGAANTMTGLLTLVFVLILIVAGFSYVKLSKH